jgi:hypothetical protein
MNIYAFLPLLSIFTNIYFGIYIFYKNRKSKLNRIFTFLSFILALWALSDFFVFSVQTAEEAILFSRPGTIAAAFVPAFLFHFFLIFTDSEFISKNAHITPVFYFPSLFFAIIDITTPFITKGADLDFWGWNLQEGILYFPFVFYVAIYIIISLIHCYIVFSKTKIKKKRTQLKYLMIAVLIPLVGGFITQVVFPAFHIKMVVLSSTLTTAMGLLIAGILSKLD